MISQNINDYNKILNFQSVQSKIGKGNDNHKRSHSDNIFKTKLLQETRQKSSNAHLGKHTRGNTLNTYNKSSLKSNAMAFSIQNVKKCTLVF